MSSDFIVRLIGMIAFAILGAYWGAIIGSGDNWITSLQRFSPEYYAIILGIIGALTGLVLTPLLTTRPIRALRTVLSRIAPQSLFAALLGLIIGLVIAALLAFPLSLLPPPLGEILPFIGVLVFSYIGVTIFIMRQSDLLSAISSTFTRGASAVASDGGKLADGRSILLDTSVIIDGRIADIARTGFLSGTLVITRFVLNELQYIADSSDSMRRQRGRRGMEVLSQLQKEPGIPIRLSDMDVEGVREVDEKLIILARQMRSPILTNDFNLNRIAELQGVTVLNVNELANAVKSAMLPGEVLSVRVIQEGKETDQGVGYMDDGTMVVIESGKVYLNQEIRVTITKVLQTAAGRMIFAKPGD